MDIPKASVLLFFPLTLALGLVTRNLLLLFGALPTGGYLLDPSNLINGIFVGHAFEIFAALFGIVSYYTFQVYKMILPVSVDDKTNQKIISGQISKVVIITTWLIVTKVWFFGDSLFDRLQEHTGATCQYPEGLEKLIARNDNYSSCERAGGLWTGGFRASGHLFILTTVLGSLAFEWRSVFVKDPSFSRWGLIPTAIVMAFWILMFWVTSIFFHTVIEKVIGIAIALAFLSILYISKACAYVNIN
ncbi:hypothetical protein PP7435_CHR2-0913 [Komagataella phaffii CBS 7435]|uniref:Uncharacterized protein n=2 Tax=Komagataella phaffii TaxID=460519 RepID=C4R0I3_KOMPG|nr:Hypothetical protein PAS_chr2-1_0385 [Komagataella phaffii GS115]AOA62213.1 GQ67_00427T0 [Komagataella phaffii]CAH2448476.1 hypothetical protein BQ9382_C2-4920 [Komagataella phaffii CBS 7435]AOA67811.1 GQ68_00962T0 [Komagataella phaffii GS115]CAY69007.1 Hypothetical protein PAS_chr2-1_0385 [Komagataella phaffii GS115]CCA38595.1 hypothetical protein PP7435_CHR2-0913 [Komagataella phaffii CBS 7435]